jgi:hypothetical protein
MEELLNEAKVQYTKTVGIEKALHTFKEAVETIAEQEVC